MQALIPGIVLLAVLIGLFIYAANKYNKGQQRIAKHVKDGNIIADPVHTEYVVGDSIIEFDLKPRHFGGEFFSNDCALGRGIKEFLPFSERSIGQKTISLQDASGHVYEYAINVSTSPNGWKADYKFSDYESDSNFVRSSYNINNETTIRSVRLIKLN